MVFFLVGCATSKINYDTAEVPSINEAWGATQYKSIAAALDAEKIPYAFFQDEKGTAVLQSIVNQKNLDFLRNKQVSPRDRLLEYVDFLNAYNEILVLYVKRLQKDKSIHSELANFLGFTLHIGEAGVDLINEFLPTIPKDENYEARLAGLAQMYRGLTKIFVGLEMSVQETEFYSSSDITLMLTAMKDTLPTIKQAFPEGFSILLHDKLIAYRENIQDSDRDLVAAMINELTSP